MNCAYITSMNKKYFDECGKLMLTSFSNKMPDSKLFVYNEDFTVDIGKNIHMQDWNMPVEYYEFQDRWNNNRVKTFAKKAFSIIHAFENIKADRIIWIDADTQIVDKIPDPIWDKICADHVLSTHFGVIHEKDDKKYFSCETGFFIVNKKHSLFNKFLQTYKNIYINDDYENLRRFYDGEVYGETVQRLQQAGATMLDLNPGQMHKTPIPRSIIGPYIKHFKAGVKNKIDVKKLLDEENEI